MPHMFSDVRAFRRDPLNFLLAKGNGAPLGLERLHLGPSPVFLVNDPDLIRPILKAPETEIGKGRLIKKLTPVFGRSSLMLHGDEHKRRRAVLHKHMAKGSVEKFLPQCARRSARSAPGWRVSDRSIPTASRQRLRFARSVLQCSGRR